MSTPIVGFAKTFVAEWNADEVDTKKALPSGTNAPPPINRLIVTAKNHKSTYSGNEPIHVSVYALTDAGWGLSPKEYGAVVHVYAKNEDPAQGYKEFFIHSRKRQKLNSQAIKDKLALAEANNLGTLGQGTLA